MWFPEHLKNTPDMIEFIKQIKGATHTSFTRSDDGPDLITMLLVSAEVRYPTGVSGTGRRVENNSRRRAYWDTTDNSEPDASAGY